MRGKKPPGALLSVSSSDVLPAFLPFSFYAYQSVLLSLFIYFISHHTNTHKESNTHQMNTHTHYVLHQVSRERILADTHTHYVLHQVSREHVLADTHTHTHTHYVLHQVSREHVLTDTNTHTTTHTPTKHCLRV